MRKLLLVLMALTFGAAHASNEEAPRPPWLNVDVLKAAIAIDMTDEQKPQFQQAVSDLVNNRARAINKIMRRNNVTDLRRKLKVASKRQFKKMDKAMAGFLTEEQYPKYEIYRDLLEDKMAEAARNRTSTGGADAEGARRGVLGNSGQQ